MSVSASPVARTRKPPIPVTVVAGPRGAGKTRLINRLLADSAFADTAVILNDFGATELAGAVVETQAGDAFVAFGAGCVCCSVRGALTDGLEDLLRGVDNNRIARVARVIIEADETADPSAIVAAITGHPYLSLRYEEDGIVVVLAADSAAHQLACRSDTARQVAMADVIALRGGMGDAALVRAVNPFAGVVDADAASPADVTGRGAFDAAEDDLAAWLALPASPAAMPGGEAEPYTSFALARERAMSFADLDQFLSYMMALQGPNLVRVRGAVATGEGETTIVDWLGTNLRPPAMVEGAASPAIRFAITTYGVSGDDFERYLDAFLNEARIDTPDREAITANPLAISGFSAR